MAGVVPSSSTWPKTYLRFRGWLTISITPTLNAQNNNKLDIVVDGNFYNFYSIIKKGISTKLGCFITYQSHSYLLTPPIVEITLFEIPATRCIRDLDNVNLIWQIDVGLEPSFTSALAASKYYLLQRGLTWPIYIHLTSFTKVKNKFLIYCTVNFCQDICRRKNP